jgi:uncharacterized protein (TIGR02284 family)
MAADHKRVIEECCDLIRFDYDAIGAYDEAIQALHEEVVRGPLTQFRADHQRHVVDLSAIVKRLGGDPPQHPGVRGVLRKTLTKMAGLLGAESVLRAMISNEEMVNKQYAKRAELTLFPDEVIQVIKKNFADEQRHLAWMQQALRERAWEKQPGAGA